MRKADHYLTLVGVGDIMLGDSPYCMGFGVGSNIVKHGAFLPFEHVEVELKKGDIVLGNLECAVSMFDFSNGSFPTIQYRGQPNSILGLKKAGFNIVSLANNHTMQHGKDALFETIDLLTQSDIKYIGIDCPEIEAKNYVFITKKQIKCAFANYNFRPRQYFVADPLWKTPNAKMILNDIEYLKSVSDVIILSLHWGDEFINYPSSEQIDLAHKIIDCGANIILGHHPHILQGVEKYKNGVIAYSLGNFIFDMWQERLRKTMILKLFISEIGNIEYEIIPVMINSRFQPQIVKGENGKRILKYIGHLSKIIFSQTNLADYNIVLRKELKKYRREIYQHYLTHLHKYNMKHLTANFMSAIGKRIINDKPNRKDL